MFVSNNEHGKQTSGNGENLDIDAMPFRLRISV